MHITDITNIPLLPRLQCFHCGKPGATNRVSLKDGCADITICLCSACLQEAKTATGFEFSPSRVHFQPAPAPEALRISAHSTTS